MSDELEEWKDALPEGNDTLDIQFKPSINIERGTVDWVINIRSQRLGHGEKYFSSSSFSPREAMMQERHSGPPLELDYICSQIENEIYNAINSYIMKEIINNE